MADLWEEPPKPQKPSSVKVTFRHLWRRGRAGSWAVFGQVLCLDGLGTKAERCGTSKKTNTRLRLKCFQPLRIALISHRQPANCGRVHIKAPGNISLDFA